MAFAKVYPMYVQKAERKNRTKTEADQIIEWLTGYDFVSDFVKAWTKVMNNDRFDLKA